VTDFCGKLAGTFAGYVEMALKSIVSRFFSSLKKPKEPSPEEAGVKTKVSPYVRFMAPESAAAPSKGGRQTTTNTLVFLPGGSAVSSKTRSQLKDAFLFDSAAQESRPLSTVGLFFPEHGALLIRDPHRGKAGQLIRWQNNRDHLPLFGDWAGSGRETLGFFDPKMAVFHLWLNEENKVPELSFLYGPAGLGWTPVVGDWDGDGKDGIGLYDPASSCFVLRNELAGGEPDVCFMYGPPGLGWIPFAGDWDGDGKDGIGIYDPLSGSFLLRNDLSGGNHDISFRIPAAGPDWMPLVGDWDGDGVDSIAIYDPGNRTFYLCTQSSVSDRDMAFRFGPVGVPGIPFAVRWMF
jgi:hypothetical protein